MRFANYWNFLNFCNQSVSVFLSKFWDPNKHFHLTVGPVLSVTHRVKRKRRWTDFTFFGLVAGLSRIFWAHRARLTYTPTASCRKWPHTKSLCTASPCARRCSFYDISSARSASTPPSLAQIFKTFWKHNSTQTWRAHVMANTTSSALWTSTIYLRARSYQARGAHFSQFYIVPFYGNRSREKRYGTLTRFDPIVGKT